MIRLILWTIPMLASLSILYFLTIRAQRTPGLDASWIDRFPNWAKPFSVPGWFLGRTWELYQFTLYPIGFLMLVAAAAGIRWLLLQRSRALLILLTAPLLLNLLAACVSQYPYGGTRVTMFLIPFECLLAGIGAAALPWRWAQIALSAVALTMAALAFYHQPRHEALASGVSRSIPITNPNPKTKMPEPKPGHVNANN